jgi:predicted restriction endonuclease
MTKKEAIRRVLEDNGGVASWDIVYNEITNYYPDAKRSTEWQAGIRGVLYREIRNNANFKMIDTGIISLKEYKEQNLVLKEDQYLITQKSIAVLIRIGQDKFRKKLLKTLKKCPITNIDDKRILNASHIKPWAISNDEERLDVDNGYIFSPIIDKLFDQYLISFEEDKTILISPSLSENNLKSIGIERNKKYHQLPIDSRRYYMEYHRNKFSHK